MSEIRQPREIDHLRRIARSLEAQAGLAPVMEQARQWRFIPDQAPRNDRPPQACLADEHDFLRQETRDAYFSVADPDLRKRLIAAQRRVQSHLRQALAEDIVTAERDAARTAERTRRQPWVAAALLGTATVAIAYLAFGTVGAIAGAVASLFLGQGLVADARNEASAEFVRASRALERAREQQAEHALMPDFFSLGEETSGNRDQRLDDELDYVVPERLTRRLAASRRAR